MNNKNSQFQQNQQPPYMSYNQPVAYSKFSNLPKDHFNGWLYLLGWLIPIIGIILGCIKNKECPKSSNTILQISIVSILLKIILVVFYLGFVFFNQ